MVFVKSYDYIDDVIRTKEISVNLNPTFWSKAIFGLNVSIKFE